MGGTVLVTGGAGFIGSHLVARLLDRGRRVVCVDSFDPYYDAALKEANIKPLLGNPRFRLAPLDIRRPRSLLRLMREEEVDLVAHLAARPGVRRSLKRPAAYMQINVQGTANVLDACVKAGVRRVVFASSSSVYGDSAARRLREDAECSPASPYGLTKRMGETLCESYHRMYGLSAIALRFFTVYGPAQRPDMAVSKFVHLVDEGREVPLYGGGTLRRDFTFVSDIVDGTVAAIERGLPGFTAINLGAGRSVSVRKMLQLVERGLGKKARVRSLPRQHGDAVATLADIGRARSLLGYRPRVSIEEGIQAYISWYLSQGKGERRPARTAA